MWGTFGLVVLVIVVVGYFCVRGRRCGKDIAVMMLHKMADEQTAKHFRESVVIPTVERCGGSIIYSGQVAQTFVGSEKWDSVVLAYFPSHTTSQTCVTTIIKQERTFTDPTRQEVDVTAATSATRSSYLPLLPQNPVAYCIFEVFLARLMACWYRNSARRRSALSGELDDDFRNPGSNPMVPTQHTAHMLPTHEAKQIFAETFADLEPFVMINIIEVDEQRNGEMEYFQYAMKVATFSLPKVGGRVIYQAPFLSGTDWSSVIFVYYPEGARSLMLMEDLDGYHNAHIHRERSIQRTLMLATKPDRVDHTGDAIKNV